MTEAVEQILAFYLCFTLVATGLAKIRSFSLARATVAANLALPGWTGRSIVTAVISLELTLAGVTAAGRWPLVTSVLLATTFLSFALYRAVLVARHRTSCGCAGSGGSVDRSVMTGHIASNVLVAALALAWGGLASGTGPELSVGATLGCITAASALPVGALRNRRRSAVA